MLTDKEKSEMLYTAKSIRRQAETLLKIIPSHALRLMAVANDIESAANNPRRKAG